MTTDEMFAPEAVQMLSPKLRWMRDHGIITFHSTPENCPPCWFAGFQAWWPDMKGIEFFAKETAHNGDSRIGEGETEADALASLMTCGEARTKGLRLWFEM